MDKQKEMSHDEYQRARTIALYRKSGLVITPPNEQDVVTIEQVKLNNGHIRTDKELIEIARHLYPDKRYKIQPITFTVDLGGVTPEWIRERMDALSLPIKSLVKHLGITSSEISVFINGKRPMSRAVRSMFYYYFLTCELNSRLHLGVTAQDLAEALDIIRVRKRLEVPNESPEDSE